MLNNTSKYILGFFLTLSLGCNGKKHSSDLSVTPEEVTQGETVELLLSLPVSIGKGDLSTSFSPGGGFSIEKTKKKR